MRKFVLIGGMPRSGTNLARRMIGSHSTIAVPPSEFKFLEQYSEGKSVREILASQGPASWKLNLSDLYSCEPRDAFVTCLMRYAASIGKEIPGEKTPLNEFYYETLQHWLKDFDLKFIHLMRNPFDVVASHKNMHGNNHTGTAYISMQSKNWQRSVAMGLARASINPTGYCLLKYEELTADPASTTQRVCAFLEVDFEPDRMLKLLDYAGHPDNTSFPQVGGSDCDRPGPIHQQESRKRYLTHSEIQLISSSCGELARAIGYDDDDFRSLPPGHASRGPGEKLRGRFARILARVQSRR